MIELNLEPGTYEYKYVIINIIERFKKIWTRLTTTRYLINGTWFLDSSKPTAKDFNGRVNNILKVLVVDHEGLINIKYCFTRLLYLFLG